MAAPYTTVRYYYTQSKGGGKRRIHNYVVEGELPLPPVALPDNPLTTVYNTNGRVHVDDRGDIETYVRGLYNTTVNAQLQSDVVYTAYLDAGNGQGVYVKGYNVGGSVGRQRMEGEILAYEHVLNCALCSQYVTSACYGVDVYGRRYLETFHFHANRDIISFIMLDTRDPTRYKKPVSATIASETENVLREDLYDKASLAQSDQEWGTTKNYYFDIRDKEHNDAHRGRKGQIARYYDFDKIRHVDKRK